MPRLTARLSQKEKFIMQKRNKMCPFCYIRRMFAPVVEQEKTRPVYDNGVGSTPLMGWSSWNTFRNRIDHDLIVATARAMKDSGLYDAGYRYVNLDDNWHSNMRDENGEWQGDLTRFPDGIPALIEELNGMGFKVGLYSSNGTLTCEDLPASLGRERDDARTLAKWGAEYFKYDFCHNIPVPRYAPLVYAVEVAPLGSGKAAEYQVSNAVLKGLARRMKCAELPGGQYVSGLDAGKGSIVFDNIVADADGEYALTVCIKKYGRYEKYLGVTVNGEECEGIMFPPQKKYETHTVLHLRMGLPQALAVGRVGRKYVAHHARYPSMVVLDKDHIFQKREAVEVRFPRAFQRPGYAGSGQRQTHVSPKPFALCVVVHDERAARARQRLAQDIQARAGHGDQPRPYRHRSGRPRQTSQTHKERTCGRARKTACRRGSGGLLLQQEQINAKEAVRCRKTRT